MKMENVEDTFIVIVGDVNNESFPPPKVIIQEKTDNDTDVGHLDNLNSIKNEKVTDIYMNNLKEPEDNTEVLQNLIKDESTDEDFYINHESLNEDFNSLERYIKEHGYQIVQPVKRKSYVNELKSQFPELKEDENLLIRCLVEVMKGTKPPPPPQDYFVMNGVMFECVECGHKSGSIPAASRHYQEKHGERYLYCLACGVNFRSTTNLYKHEKRCNAPDAKIVLLARALSLGGKGRSRPYVPNIITETKPIRYDCTECSATFFNKHTLKAHQNLHRGKRPYRCPKCPAAYTSKTAQSRHVKKHGDTEYICDHCQRSFKLKAALVTHMDTHRPLKRFVCDSCDKRYSQKAALVRHVNKVHRNLPPPHACMVCPRRYPRMSLLKEHMKKVHGMNIITRKMFLKKLPMLTDTQVQEAKVIFKSEVHDPSYNILHT